MATCLGQRIPLSLYSEFLQIPKLLRHARSSPRSQYCRTLKTSSTEHKKVPSFAFAFDIDGVLLRSSAPLPQASKTLSRLQRSNIPFILLTNGGGKHESERVHDLGRILEIPLDTSMFVQSHTPFTELVNAPTSDTDKTPLKNKTILVVGGEGDQCRKVAESYGFRNVVTPSDILAAHPPLWPFSFPPEHHQHACPLPLPLYIPNSTSPSNSPPPSPTSHLTISAILIFHDPRSWALDTQLLLDLLLSHAGILGTTSSLNNTPSLPNRGYQQDAQPRLYFSNPDLFWAASHHMPRLGQGGFREAFEGVWAAVTGGKEKGVELRKEMFGKPYRATYEFAEKRLEDHRLSLLGGKRSKDLTTGGLEMESEDSMTKGLERVYMVGDNPASDILGANDYDSPRGREWRSILVRTGVYSGGEIPQGSEPDMIVDGVGEAVRWALKQEGWDGPE